MIAPHIKWDHSDDHFVMHFDDDDSAKCAERRVKISLNDVEYEYIQGHCIDGKYAINLLKSFSAYSNF